MSINNQRQKSVDTELLMNFDLRKLKYSCIINLIISFFLFSGIYLTCTMAITTLSMVLTVFVLNLHHITDRPVPTWVKRLVFIYLARMLCMCSAIESDSANNSPVNTKNKKLGLYRQPVDTMVSDCEERTAIIELQNRGVNGGTESAKLSPQLSETSYPMLNRMRQEEEKKEPNYSKDWVKIAPLLSLTAPMTAVSPETETE